RPRDADLRSRGGPDIVRTVDAGQRHSRTCGGQQGLRRQAIKYDGRLEVAGPKFIDECRTDGAGEREIVQARVVGNGGQRLNIVRAATYVNLSSVRGSRLCPIP